MSLEYDSEQSESESFDDLIDFEELRQNQIVEQIMKMKPSRTEKVDLNNIVPDDAELIRGNSNARQEEKKLQKKEKEITEEQRKAREMKILNARKYFETVKLMYIQHVSASLQQATNIIQHHRQIVACWLSFLSKDLLLQFMKYKKTKPLSINIEEFLNFMRKTKYHIDRFQKKEKTKSIQWNKLFWSLCQELKLGCRKVHFFSVDSIVEETFFQLKYQTSEAIRKRENKKLKEHQIMKIKLSQQIQQNFQNEEDSSKYFLFQDYQFDEASFKSRTKNGSRTVEETNQTQETRRQSNFMRKKNFKNNYFQLFDPSSNTWILLNSELYVVERADDMKKLILEGKFILSFYSTRIVHFKAEYEDVFSLRAFKEITIEDLTMFFEDNHRNLTKRRKRIGLKLILRHIFEESSFDKNRFMLESYDQLLLNKNDSLELEYQLTIFPKTKDEMFTSNFFIVPSQLPQYTILNPEALQVPDVSFNEEKVYLRKDIIAVTSKVHWIDRGRKVKAGQIPVKKTENKSKNLTELFLYQQTEPFSLDIGFDNGDFLHDGDFNSIYIPTDFVPPPEMMILKEKVGVVCKKNKIRHSKVVQGFTRAAGKIVPNQIGYIIYKNDEKQILRLFEERQKKLEENKGKNRLKQLTALWNKLFKKIQLHQWSKTFQEK